MTLRVLLDARKLGDGGIGVYLENLVDGMLALDSGEKTALTLLVRPAHFALLESPAGDDSVVESAVQRWSARVRFIADSSRNYSAEEYLLMAIRQRRLIQRHDIFHSPHYTLPFFIGIPRVVTIHDVIHVSHPEHAAHKIVGGALIRSAVRRADAVISVSECSKKALLEVAGVQATAKIHVVENALKPELTVLSAQARDDFRAAHRLTRPFYLFVGSDRPHKGLRELLQAWAILRRDQNAGWSEKELILVGRRYGAEAREIISDLGLSPVVRFIDQADEATLRGLYNNAEAVLVPSQVEGFGLVALEAMACGTAVLCSPAESLSEVCADCAWYMEDYSAAALATLLGEMAFSDERRLEKIRRGILRAQEFSIQRAAEKTLAVYSTIQDHYGKGKAGDRAD